MESAIQKLHEKGAERMHVSKGDEKDDSVYNCKGKEKHLNIERKRNQKGINNLPAISISNPTHRNMEQQVLKVDNIPQNRPSSGYKGEECPAMEHMRSKVEPKLQNEPNKPRNRMAEMQYKPTNKPMKPKMYMEGVIQIVIRE
eukprot:12460589-Ditylum_brightwellii.AAC.1